MIIFRWWLDDHIRFYIFFKFFSKLDVALVHIGFNFGLNCIRKTFEEINNMKKLQLSASKYWCVLFNIIDKKKALQRKRIENKVWLTEIGNRASWFLMMTFAFARGPCPWWGWWRRGPHAAGSWTDHDGGRRRRWLLWRTITTPCCTPVHMSSSSMHLCLGCHQNRVTTSSSSCRDRCSSHSVLLLLLI